MFGIQPQELLVILVVALIVVGPRKLPELGRSLGKGLRELRKAQDEVRKTVQVNLDEEEPPRTRAGASSSPRPQATGDDEDPSPGSTGAADADGASGVGDITRTLGRGLGELRRARDEVERSFRVDLNEANPSPRPARPARPPTAAGTGPSNPESDASDASDDGAAE